MFRIKDKAQCHFARLICLRLKKNGTHFYISKTIKSKAVSVLLAQEQTVFVFVNSLNSLKSNYSRLPLVDCLSFLTLALKTLSDTVSDSLAMQNC